MRLVYGRGYYDPSVYVFGALWSFNPDAPEGEYLYRRGLILHIRLPKIWMERR